MRQKASCSSLIAGVAIVFFSMVLPSAMSQDANNTKVDSATKAASASQTSTAIKSAITEAAKKFEADFDRGDASAVAAHWSLDGVYIDEIGKTYTGREAIEKEYKSFFAAYPGIKIRVSVDSVHVINDQTAIEHGRATLGPMPDGPPAHSRYTAVHVKKDGNWHMSFVRDSRVEIASKHPHLADLEYLVGNWHTENEGRHLEMTCSWHDNKNYLERIFTVREKGNVISTSKEIIGWDPLSEQIVSTTFTSDGGKAVGSWSPHDSGWVIETVGVSAEGGASSSVIVLSHVDDNAMAWESTDRFKGGVSLPDMQQIVIHRK